MPPLFNILIRSKFLWVIYLILPLVFGILIYSIFSKSIPRQLPIGIIDEDNSTLSQEIIYHITHSAALQPIKFYHSIRDAKQDLSVSKIYALAVIPKDLQKNLSLGQKIVFYYNAQFILIGKALDSAMLEITATINAKLQTASYLAKTTNLSLALGKSVPIFVHIHPLFNPKSNYAQFLSTLILPCIWQILVALGMLNLLSSPLQNSQDLIYRFCFNIFIFTFWGMMMVYFFDLMHYPLFGSVAFIFFGFFIFGIGMSSIVVFLESIFQNPTKSISYIAAYTAPGLAFAGVTYPQSAMENFAVFWSHILPISYFMEFYFHQANYGGNLIDGLKILFKMSPFICFFPIGWLIYRVRGKL